MKFINKIKKETGQAMVEFALVLPILLLLIGGIVDFGWIFFNQISANNAAREAARYVAVHYKIAPINEVMSAAITEATNKINENILDSYTIESVTIDHNYEVPGVTDGGEYITVNLDGKVIVLTPILQAFLGDECSIDVSCTMRVEK